jgi:outer membrane protein OmpA-like peptidoglycan-associated protein
MFFMKRILWIFIASLISLNLSAQSADSTSMDEESKLGISFRRMFMDFQTTNGGQFGNFAQYSSGYELGVKYKLQPNLVFEVPVRLGLKKPVLDLENPDSTTNVRTFSIDAQLHFSFTPENKIWQPGLYAGIGLFMEDWSDIDAQIPIGLFINFPVSKRSSIDWHSEFRKSFSEGKDNFQHGIGFTYWFGSSKEEVPVEEEEKPAMKDSDEDGISDDLDLCPHIPGPPEFFGCPDSDGDGIHDLKDKCPSIFGLKKFDGCPDSDGDGIMDNEDECPNLKGIIENKGCPDTDMDGDGIVDRLDECPKQAGVPSNNGCPENIPDSDGDGIADNVDACPFSAGLAEFDGCPDSDGDGIPDPSDDCPLSPGVRENNGCPPIQKEDREILEFAMRAVQFDLGKATLRPESYRILDQVSRILQKYDDYNLSISGHTDNTGSALNNQRLSENRAKSCYDYLVSKGVSPSRLSYAGYGESTPIADNQTLEGRTLNRRVEFTLVPRRR